MKDTYISDSVLYIGVTDKTLDLFESQYQVPNGVTYNSYVIMDDKIAVMDTVDGRATEQWFANLEQALAGEPADYLIVSHMEPDHAANIKRFAERFPEAKIVGNAKTFANKAKILQIDIDAAEINKNVLVDAYIEGDIKEVLRRLLEEIPEKKHPQWMEHIQEMKAKYPLNYDHTQLTGPYIIEKLYELTDGDAIITTDVGQHQMWAAQYYKYKEPRTFLSSGGLGTMGFGLGAAIGAKMGRPEKTVVNIAGDGCFRMNMNEIATAVRCGKPLVQIVLNNHVLGMVRQWQTLFYDHRYSHTVLNDAVDFVKISEGMGAKAIRVTKMEEVESALKEALSSDGPVVLDCWIDQDLSVFPMVPAGANIDDVFDEEDMKNEQSV